MKIKNKKES